MPLLTDEGVDTTELPEVLPVCHSCVIPVGAVGCKAVKSAVAGEHKLIEVDVGTGAETLLTIKVSVAYVAL